MRRRQRNAYAIASTPIDAAHTTSTRLAFEVRRCCHHGHGAAVFADGTVMQAISSNDVVARGNGAGGWEWRIGYVDDPKVTRDELQEIFDYAERMENGEY